MGCVASTPPPYVAVRYPDRAGLIKLLKHLATSTDPDSWRLAYGQASSRIASAHGQTPVDAEFAYTRAGVVGLYAMAAVAALRRVVGVDEGEVVL